MENEKPGILDETVIAAQNPSPETQLHVFDLPQLYQKPSSNELENALSMLRQQPLSFDLIEDPLARRIPQVNAEGVPKYLTSIVSSELEWIDSEESKEKIWQHASRCLSERSGRSAQSAMTRKFNIQMTKTGTVSVEIHEPAYTSDNIGMKTWSASYILANLLVHFGQPRPSSDKSASVNTVLELGAGTGLVGIAAALVWKRPVILTDLPSIEPNLTRNVDFNRELLRDHKAGKMQSGILDWASPDTLYLKQTDGSYREQKNMTFHAILVADPIYSEAHPNLLAGAIQKTLVKHSATARVILALPLRKGYDQERSYLAKALSHIGLIVIDCQYHTGFDDWGPQGNRTSVHHEITVWAWKFIKQNA